MKNVFQTLSPKYIVLKYRRVTQPRQAAAETWLLNPRTSPSPQPYVQSEARVSQSVSRNPKFQSLTDHVTGMTSFSKAHADYILEQGSIVWGPVSSLIQRAQCNTITWAARTWAVLNVINKLTHLQPAPPPPPWQRQTFRPRTRGRGREGGRGK